MVQQRESQPELYWERDSQLQDKEIAVPVKIMTFVTECIQVSDTFIILKHNFSQQNACCFIYHFI